ncbi:small integral membrane protein 14 [Cloeon dipterum]|uniref:small integral membrane protein 14 n=1 Tax=Cloeon dipterum TaxID=197152 RepID=UPI00321FD480
MGDDEFDPCECIWNHEMAMRRLLSLLRQGQSYCTDTQCFDPPLSGGLQSDSGSNDGLFLMMMGWVMLAVVLYMTRPASLRGPGLDAKPNNNDLPPPPPPATL